MKFIKPIFQLNLLVVPLVALALAGCVNNERSRNWANPQVKGEVLVQQVCSTCHGIDGQSQNGQFPKLAGQNKDYIVGQLEAIKGRERNSTHTKQFMWGPGRYLTPKQMDEIGTYFANMPPMKANNVDPSVITDVTSYFSKPDPNFAYGPSYQVGAADAGLIAKGNEIFHKGVPSKGVKACASCHGEYGEGDAPIPRVAGQHAYYLNYRARIAMTKIMANLSDAEIHSISLYLASIQGPPNIDKAELEPVGKDSYAGEDKENDCHFSVWTYGWYCGSWWEAFKVALKSNVYEPSALSQFKAIDTDHNGSISVAEAKVAGLSDATLKQLDADADGVISENEFLAGKVAEQSQLPYSTL